MRKLIFCLMAVALPVQAQVLGGSNIALSDYPGPSCTKPQMPEVPEVKTGDSGAPAAYNARVKQYNHDVAGYNTAIADFNVCMHTYVENGNADMQRIKQKLDDAVAAANAK